MYTADNLAGAPGIAHGFFGREGGVSAGIYASLNCGPGSDDDRAAVIANRDIALAKLADGAKATLVTLYQIHSAQCVTVGTAWPIGAGPRADAMVTAVPGMALGILTADCAPILLADERARIVGAAHAGWKGALGGVVESVLTAMERLGAQRSRIKAAIGPCIAQANYEVGPEFRARFLKEDARHESFFVAAGRTDHFHFDLPGFAAGRLASGGVEDVRVLRLCTYANADNFYSYRRATHRGETDYGREISVIMLQA